jgi:hypothetical protein
MIERLVFIATMVLFMMVGINGFILVGNEMCMSDGTRLNLIGTSTLPCGTLDNAQGLGISNIIQDANGIQAAPGTTSTSTQAPGSASSVVNFVSGGISAAWLGINWLVSMLGAGIFLGLKLAGLFPFFAPIIYIFVSIIAALEGFALMYWTMAGARAFLGRFL